MKELMITGIFIGFGILLLLISIALWIVGRHQYYKEMNEDELDRYWTPAIILTVLSCMAIFCSVPYHIDNGIEYNKEYTNITYISSLRGTSETEGHFILGCGTIDNKQYYIAYEIIGENDYGKQYAQFKIKADGVIITENNALDPQYMVKKEKGSLYETFELYVPIGTIRQEYKL